MQFHLKPFDPDKLEVDLLITFCFAKDADTFQLFTSALTEDFQFAKEKEDFHGNKKEIVILSSNGQISAYKIAVAGLGQIEDISIFEIQTQIALAMRIANQMHLTKVGFVLPVSWLGTYPTETVVRALVEAVSLSSYRFLVYKGEAEKKKRSVSDVFISLPAGKIASAEQGIHTGTINSEATLFARDLINEPPFITTPTFLAEKALAFAKSSKGSVKSTILEKDDCLKLGMHAFLGVSKGSDEPPKFIILHYKPKNAKKKVALVGKGITFDTGGLSIKDAKNMETMKLDMSGAAAVLSVFAALPKLAPVVEVVGIIAACENMPSGRALKPGDILIAMNGKTIEVLNTDAEGRLTLADALSYAILKEKPQEIIELSTLTGACMVALGEEIAGLWGNDEKLISGIKESARDAGEKVWQMPLENGYKELIKSTIADVKNIQTGRYGGAITAALFLSEFAGSTPWVHLDIAGPAFAEKDTPLTPAGGAGFGARLLLHYLCSR